MNKSYRPDESATKQEMQYHQHPPGPLPQAGGCLVCSPFKLANAEAFIRYRCKLQFPKAPQCRF